MTAPRASRATTRARSRTAYSVKPLLDKGKDGTGRTIVIVDAFQNPYLASDLTTFDQSFGLPDRRLHQHGDAG